MFRDDSFQSDPVRDFQQEFTPRDRRSLREDRPRPGGTRIRRIVKGTQSKYRFDHRYLPDDEDF